MQTGKIANSVLALFSLVLITTYAIVFTEKAWLLYSNLFFPVRFFAADWIKLVYYAAKVLDSV